MPALPHTPKLQLLWIVVHHDAQLSLDIGPAPIRKPAAYLPDVISGRHGIASSVPGPRAQPRDLEHPLDPTPSADENTTRRLSPRPPNEAPMLPLNPFLGAFFKSPLPAQCAQTHQHILLVPTVDVLLTHHESETGASAPEILLSEEFIASHVIRIPGAGVNGAAPEPVPNLREIRGKAKQYSTINGRSIVMKDGFVYSNKGFRAPNEAQLLHDVLWYSDALEPRQWLIYYISKPLIGTWVEDIIEPAILVEGVSKKNADEQRLKSPAESSERGALGRKKEIKYFHDLLNHFPLIARHMQPGLERLFRDFNTAFERPLPPLPSDTNIPDPEPEGPITEAMKKARSNSMRPVASGRPGSSRSNDGLLVEEDFFAEDEEDVMRATLESAITAAIDIFQSVEKSQLSMLAATTDLTGAVVEKLLERYITENVHHLLFPKLCALKRPHDLELESKIRQMVFIDVSQLGIVIQGGVKGKHDLVIQIERAVEEFGKMGNARSPQEMLSLLVSTIKTVTSVVESRPEEITVESDAASEKPLLTINADTLVSLLLFVVIRAQVKNLQARFAYIRHFVFIEDIDTGEAGYALSTFEAVLSYLALDSGALRKASRRNKALWDAASGGLLETLKEIMEPTSNVIDDDDDDEDKEAEHLVLSFQSSRSSRRASTSGSVANVPRRPSTSLTLSEHFSRGTGLSHVFPFQSGAGEDTPPYETYQPPAQRLKRVTMDTRSLSSSSEISFRSRATSFGSIGSAMEADLSVERLSQTHNSFGESVLMMAIGSSQVEMVQYLLSLSQHYPLPFILEDANNEDTTLLCYAVQCGDRRIIKMILDLVTSSATSEQVARYFAKQDIWGRSVGHYLFHVPELIDVVGNWIPWRQRDKNGQTPLFALCRSYDQENYSSMVAAGLDTAQKAQGDGEPLHVDDHVDNKGNTLLHIVTDPLLVLHILQRCDVDVNATNDRKFTPLMLASKYGRYDLVRMLVSDPRVDLAARELRGLTAVELAKDDEIRNKIDDLALFSRVPDADGRITGVVRAFFVEDGTVRLVLKSAVPTGDGSSFTVTTCRRSLTDFEGLAALLAVENPSSWIPPVGVARSPFQIPSKPSRAMLRDIQARADWFMRIMLAHPTFAAHETLWEFFLVPEIRLDMMGKRAKLKAEALREKIRDEMEPVENVGDVEQFVDYARETVRSVSHSTRSVTRRVNRAGVAAADLYDASRLLRRAVCTLEFLPRPYKAALEMWTRCLEPSQSSPHATLHSALLAQQSTVTALLSALSRPPTLIAQIRAARKTMERNYSSVGRPARWPLGLLEDAKQAQKTSEERGEKARRSREAAEDLARELGFVRGVVAGELAGWQDGRERMGRRAVREFARGMVVGERARLEGLRRALRCLREGG
ncbi:related to VPS9 domain protein [Cephalotrichum gorgonifer]|uniref:Related to VPS9 domain protein n=1 Tax=Cephalotrichum gorgonifer TaxID=2041049 RepID=A0AAE8N0X1_9PEZI|nr:related to VPS9 domain protein [Cephalotrichum gorgonifer]